MLTMKIAVGVVLAVYIQFCKSQANFPVAPSSYDWCAPNLNCGSLKNSMCTLTPLRNTQRCFYIEDVMTAEDKRVLLAMHNTYRDQLAGGAIDGWVQAADMRQMSWDDTLAAQATLWALQCKDESDPCPRHPVYPLVGQAAIEVGDTTSFPDTFTLFERMTQQSKKAPKGITNSYKPNKDYASFAQLIFSVQTKVGCGLVRFFQQEKNKEPLITLSLWCNYDVGISKGNKTYVEGQACSFCPDGTDCNPSSTYRNLCCEPHEPSVAAYIPIVRVARQSRGNLFLPIPLLTITSILLLIINM